MRAYRGGRPRLCSEGRQRSNQSVSTSGHTTFDRDLRCLALVVSRVHRGIPTASGSFAEREEQPYICQPTGESYRLNSLQEMY